MLAHKMNGEGLRPDHGRPLRAVVPGQIGGRSVKWLKKLIITDRPSDNWYHIYDNRVLPLVSLLCIETNFTLTCGHKEQRLLLNKRPKKRNGGTMSGTLYTTSTSTQLLLILNMTRSCICQLRIRHTPQEDMLTAAVADESIELKFHLIKENVS